MSRKMMKLSALCASLTLAAAIAGCGTSNKEGAISLDSVAKVDEALCAQCHGAAIETLSGDEIYENYTESVHALKAVGCQDCHGGGAQHNGIGPIPYPKPNHAQCKSCHDDDGLVTAYEGSKHLGADTEDGRAVCNRCHTHQGAVLAAKFHYTGDGEFLEDEANEAITPGVIANPEPIKCNTCHVTHKPNELRVDSEHNPAAAVGVPTVLPSLGGPYAGNDQYRLCTQCHTYINKDGVLTGSGTTDSGTALVGHHETSWYRIIASTHYDDPATEDIEGYGIRTTGSDPCFDCHNHESKTNTLSGDATIYTDWANSGHAGEILVSKKAAAATITIPAGSRTDPARVAAQKLQVDTVMAAVSDTPIETGSSCVRCHTSTGLVQFLATPAAGGSITDNGDGTATTVASTLTASPVGELTMCWGCHTNAGTGELRTLAGTASDTDYTTDLGHRPTAYALFDGKLAFPDVAGSNLCVSCHDGRNSNPAQVALTTQTTPAGTHYMPAAGVMYVKTGFINFSTGNTYLRTLKADLDAGSITSPHRKLGPPAINGDSHNTSFFVAGNLDSNGPCVVCHLTGSHTLKMDQKAIDTVCVNCHDSEAGIDITTKAAFDEHFLEPQFEVYEDAIKLAVDLFNSRQDIIDIAADDHGVYRRYYDAGTTTSSNAADWTAVATALSMDPKKLMGAIGNVTMFSKDKGGYAHARTYSRRLLYDSIDYLDDGSMNQSVSATAIARSAVVGSLVEGKYSKGAKAYTTSATVGDVATGTSESALYLFGYNRSSGAWNTPDRP